MSEEFKEISAKAAAATAGIKPGALGIGLSAKTAAAIAAATAPSHGSIQKMLKDARLAQTESIARLMPRTTLPQSSVALKIPASPVVETNRQMRTMVDQLGVLIEVMTAMQAREEADAKRNWQMNMFIASVAVAGVIVGVLAIVFS